MNIPEDSDLICVSGPWGTDRVYKLSKIEKDIRNSVETCSYPRSNEFKVIFPDGTWKTITFKVEYEIKIEEICEPLTTPPPPPVFERDNDDTWPPPDNLIN